MILTIASVVYNEENHIDLITENLRYISRFSSAIQFLIIDNGSTDDTFQRLIELQKLYSFQLVRRLVNNLGAARGGAVLSSPTPWISFLDGDCAVGGDWAPSALAYLTELPAEISGVGGPWEPAGRNKKLYQALFKTFFGNFNMPQIRNDESARIVSHIPTASVIYRRADVLEVGNFKDDSQNVGEDLDLSYRLLSRGKRLLMTPKLRFDHYLPESLNEWARKIFSYGEARMRIAVAHRDFLALTYLLPVIFLIFMAVNVLFCRSLLGLPVLAYLAVAFALSFVSAPSLKSLKVVTFMVTTHFAYSSGMIFALGVLISRKILRRRQLVPIDCRPQSVEEI